MTRTLHRLLVAVLSALLICGGTLAVTTESAFAAVAINEMTVLSSDTTTIYGQSVTFRADVSAATNPTGTVDFLDGATVICSAEVLTNGFTTCTTTTLPVGSRSITATYGGDIDYLPANSTDFHPALVQVVSDATTTTVATPSVNPSTFGNNVVLSAAVTPTVGSATPTGDIAFRADGVDIVDCDAETLINGSVTCGTTALAGGDRTITAVYSPGPNFVTSTSPDFIQTVNPAGTSTALVAAPDPSNPSQAVELTATVTSTAGTPDGLVAFKAGATNIVGCEAETLISGSVSCDTSDLVGTQTLTAVYAGTPSYATSTSADTSHLVNEPTTTSVAANVDPSVFSEPVVFTATVASTGNAPGFIDFQRAGVTIAGCDAAPLVVASPTTTTAMCGTTTLPTGVDQPISAHYGGGTGYAPSDSANHLQTVAVASTTTVATSSDATTVFSEPVTFTATVSPTAPATATPAGTVSFSVDGNPITACTTQSMNGSGVATCATSGLAVGTGSITAAYSGNANSTSSGSPAISQVVAKAASATALSSSVNPSAYSAPVTFTATVTPVAPGTGTPTGTVAFKVGGIDITGCGAKTTTAGAATCTAPAFTVGDHSITAVYATTTNHLASTSAPTTQAVARATTTTVVASSDATSDWSQSVTFTATMSPAGPATLSPAGGTVSFSANTVPITACTAQTVTTGTATCTTTALPVGTTSLTATSSGDASFLTSTSPAIIQTVSNAPTTTTLSSNHNPSRWGQAVTLSAVVSSIAGPPSGSIEFFMVRKDDTLKSIGVVPLTAGTAIMTTDELPVRVGEVVAEYDGAPNFATSTDTLQQTVSRSFSGVTVTSSANPSALGRAVSFRATVWSSGDGAGTPEGLVALYRVRPNDSRQWIGRGFLENGVVTIVVTDEPLGVHKIVAEYRGDVHHRESSRQIQQRVNKR